MSESVNIKKKSGADEWRREGVEENEEHNCGC